MADGAAEVTSNGTAIPGEFGGYALDRRRHGSLLLKPATSEFRPEKGPPLAVPHTVPHTVLSVWIGPTIND